MSIRARQHLLVMALIALLALLAYGPLLRLPLIEDDYPNLEMSRDFGLTAALPHPIYRLRATFWLLTAAAFNLVGCSAPALHSLSLALHIGAAWLVYALGAWRPIGWRTAAVGAGFFAVAEGHQEAVMWYSAASEELMVAFGLLALLGWVRYLDTPEHRLWYPAALAAFALALLSKESAVVLAPLLLLPLFGLRSAGRGLLLWLPFAALALAAALLIVSTRAYSFRFEDGSFSLAAPFWITWPLSLGRLLWPWGALAALVLLWLRGRRLLLVGGCWMVLGLAPYSFLTYMHRVPSRQTYLASVGLAWLVGAGFWALRGRLRRSRGAVVLFLALLVVGANAGYLWTRKRDQFLHRAAPSEALVALARRSSAPVYVRCYPGPPIVADAAVRLRAPAAPPLLWNPAPGAAEFCWKP